MCCACGDLDRRSKVKSPHCIGRPATTGFASFSNCWRCLVISFRNWIETRSIPPKTIGTSFAYIHTYVYTCMYILMVTYAFVRVWFFCCFRGVNLTLRGKIVKREPAKVVIVVFDLDKPLVVKERVWNLFMKFMQILRIFINQYLYM